MLVLLGIIGAALFYHAASPTEGETEITGTYRYEITLTTPAPLQNLSLILPLPVENGTSAIGEMLVGGDGYGVPENWSLAVTEVDGTPVLVVTAAEVLPRYAPRPVAVTPGDEPEEGVTITYSPEYSDDTPVLLPFRMGATVEAGTETYTAEREPGPIDTRHPLGAEPVLAPKHNLTTVSEREYLYTTPLFLHCDAPAGTVVRVTITLSGSNEWWLLGWSSNSYTDLITAEVPADGGWQTVAGRLVTGEGRYFRRS
ncbi:hypothetical protein CUJ86_10475 [Methanofollis fontis]|uniref:Uncharacterized protein n=1 Tax=Methanofollis fontis TaxID=2052832 RepID=A0A483CLZ6_9EURY|nr:hypothetical protein CUJ86_10475 [Methanofollis fontis]